MKNPFNFLKKKSTALMVGGNQDARFWPSTLRSLFQRSSTLTKANIHVTSESAFQLAAYWLAVRAISEDIAKLPINLFTLDRDGKKKPIIKSPLQQVLTQGFNSELDSMTGMQTLIQWMLTYGNAYAEVQFNSLGEMQWALIHPERVSVNRNGQGNLEYTVTTSSELDNRNLINQRTTTLQANQILHLKGPGNGVVGFSIGEIAAQSLGISIAAQDFTGAFFGNNLSLGAVLETDKPLKIEQKKEIRKDWKDNFGGSSKAGELAVLDRGFKFSRIQMASTDAELLSTRKFQIEELARWFRIPPHKLMDMSKSTFNNVEQQDINYATDSLTPWISRLEVQLKFRFHRTDNTVIDIDEKALSRGDMKSRAAFSKEMFAMGAMSRNEVRMSEGLAEVDDGNTFYIPMNLVPITQGLESAQLDNEIKKKDLQPEPSVEGDGEMVQGAGKLSPEALKSKADSYGVAMRAGAITPQEVDEKIFREEFGLPVMSSEVVETWKEEGGVRRPMTLVSPAAEEIEEAEAAAATSGTSKQSTVTEQAAISAYLPSMTDSISRLTRKEQLNHDAAGKKEPQQMKEHLDKFYSKFEAELKDCLQLHANYICNVLSKEMFTSDKLLFMSQEICQLEKTDNQADIIVKMLLKEFKEVV